MKENDNHTDLLAKWLNNDLTSEQRKQFDENPEYGDLKIVVEDIDTWKAPAFSLQESFEKLQAKKELPQKESRVIQMTSWLRVAASVVLIVGAYLSWDLLFNTNVLIQTGIGEKQKVELPDGSVIQLDASSSLAYSKKGWEENRIVTIEGQAFLEIISGGSFVAETNLGTVSVLGTKFNIKVDETIFNVSCYEGRVKVESGNLMEQLQANEGVRLTNNKLTRFSISEQLDWINEYSSFSQQPLSEVVLNLKKYYDIDLGLPNRYSDMLFTGQFPHNDLDQALRSIFTTMEIDYTLSNNKVDFD